LNSLLRGFDERDGELAARALQDGVFKYNENEFAKLARDLKIPGKAAGEQNAAPAQQTAAVQDQEPEDFESGDMC